MAVITPSYTPIQAAAAGNKYWFYRQAITVGDATDAGGTYNIDVSAKAIAIGPNSMIDQARATFWSADGVQFSNEQFAVDRPLILPMTSLPTKQGLLASTIRRITIVNDVRSIDSTAVALVAPSSQFEINVEFIVYFDDPPEIPLRRTPIVRSAVTTVDDTNVVCFCFPSYGRKNNTFTFENSGANSITWQLEGLMYNATTGLITHVISPTSGSNTLASGAVASYVLQGAKYDYIRLRATNTGGNSTLDWTVESADA